jgi:DNA-binding Lrp family transcriptional regulator
VFVDSLFPIGSRFVPSSSLRRLFAILAELGKRIGLAISAVNERLKKMRARGDIRAYVALINPVLVVAAIVVLCFGPSTRGKPLQEA